MDIINMEALYDIGSGDLKDIWESDLDPSDTIKFSSDSDMQDWFERDVKLPGVILHDKLMSDALLGTLPIKTEHSYSLNSDGDSMPESPGSLKNKMDDMEDECYPAISMNTATSNSRRLIDPTQLTTTHINPAEISLNNCSILTNNHNNHHSNNSNNINNNNNNIHHLNNNNNSNHSSTCHLTILNNCSTNNISINPNNLQNTLNPLAINIRPKHVTDQLYSGNSSSTSSLSDIDIDDSCIKDEPMSPDDSSCPPSPLSVNTTTYLTNITSPFTNSANIIVEHKNRSIQLTPASQSLLKAQQINLGNGISGTISNNTNSLTSSPQRLVLPKVNIKIESPTNSTQQQLHQQHQQQQQQQQQHQQQTFGLPPTPPSSLPSDESEGNQSPEHHLLSPMSPPMQQQLISSSSSSSSTNSSPAASPSTSTSRRNQNIGGQTISGAASSTHHNNSNANNSGRGYTGTSTRQPIHTPLISSQPKGSTGTLILTEEEKRTLLAEGYPIPTRLPLTKAEEKSLKKIRRKIKNKISAQESRRKKKEYMDQLERKVEILVSENTDYKKRVESLEESNTNLLTQLAKLQTLLNRQKKSN